jgi:hypothetical protein
MEEKFFYAQTHALEKGESRKGWKNMEKMLIFRKFISTLSFDFLLSDFWDKFADFYVEVRMFK